MKRKRGHKKGKNKKHPVAGVNEASPNVVSIDVEEDSDTDMHDNVESETRVNGETTSSAGQDQPNKFANINFNGVAPKPVAVYGRVKVKLKTSKPLDHQLTSPDTPSKTLDQLTSSDPPVKTLDHQVTSSDAPTQSDTDRSIQQPSLDKQGLHTEKVEDSANSLPEMGLSVSDNVSRKSGSIKIKSAKGFGSKSINQDIDATKQPHDRARQQESIVPHKRSKHNKQELVAALEVIKKIMKMDAAEPFNAPVNPVELGIPDYFDVIDTPMDFGTICDNLECGTKYMNSEDVYNDVRYIWDNCYKYNNKGDYIVDLMKRVKKNFAKYWAAAGLYTCQPKSTNGEGILKEEASLSSHGKKMKKGKGVKRHKDGCLCAICIMKRRRKERVAREAQEAREARKQGSQYEFGTFGSSPATDIKQESAHIESPRGEETSSYMETSADADADVELNDTGADRRMGASTMQGNGEEEEENHMDSQDEVNRYAGTPEQSQRGGGGESESYPTTELKTLDDSGGRVKTDFDKQSTQQNGSQSTSHHQLKRELLEQEKKRQRSKLYENILSIHHPMLLELAGTLFSDSSGHVWNGPHSLVRSRKSYCSSSDIHGAVDSFMSISKP